jgi:hypothetical protein
MALYTNGIFTDEVSSAVFPSLIYVTGSGGSDTGAYVTSSLPNPATTSATMRIGTYVRRITPSTKTFEKTDVVGGVRLGNITMFETENRQNKLI